MEKTGSKPIDDLISLAKDGNGLAFTALWDRYIEQLRIYLRTFSSQVIDIDDICSRSFEKAFRQIHHYDTNKSQFYTWLKTIARNTALDMIAKEQRVHPKDQYVSIDDYSKLPFSDNEENALDNIINEEQDAENKAYINGLSDTYREVAYKRLIEGLSYKEIAEELDLSLNTVKTRIKRAKEQIEKMRND